MIELFNAYAQIDISKIAEQTDAILELAPDAQKSLSVLIDSTKAREISEERKLAATKRVVSATAAEHEAAQALADFSLPIPFSAAGIPAAQMKEARAAHDLKCRQLLEHRARRVASGTSDADGVATMSTEGKWTNVVPGKKTGHAKTKGPSSFKIALDKAEAELTEARAQLNTAMDQARRASKIEADALTHFQSLQKRPTQDEVLRENAKRSLEMRAQNAREGLPPGGIVKPTHGKSPIDVLAAQRPRGSGPLRSPVQRRNVV